ncbi:MAG: hypothetical protein ACRDF4_08695 [Rhabdochlamydiaceae bacterium]
MADRVLLGYEVGSGDRIDIEVTHLVVTGITNQSGKTTLLEGIASRAGGYKFLVFKTKPHEQQFATAGRVKPFFRERTDWEYVAGILEASRNERMKFERFWIMRASKGAETLRQVDKNCQALMEEEREGGLAYSIYYQLHEYFKKILPELEEWNLADRFPELHNGINVMDLGEMSDGVQMLIIESCLAHILKSEKRITTIIPELWKFSPEGKRSPVKDHIDRLIRQGAAGKNFVWFDSQDMAGVDKGPLKQCYTWILGLQVERNEIKHTLDQINLPKKAKPASDQISSLKLGQFFLSTPKGVKHFYAAPVWLPADKATLVARGELQPDEKHIADYKEDYEKTAQKALAGKLTWKDVENHALEKEQRERGESADLAIAQLRREFQAFEQKEDANTNALAGILSDIKGRMKKLEERPSSSTAVSSPLVELKDQKLILKITDAASRIFPLSTKNRDGQIAFTLYRLLDGKPSLPWEISKAAADRRGWIINTDNFKRDSKPLLDCGIIVMDENKRYKKPEEIKVEFEDASAN